MAPRAPLGTPVWKPFLNRRAMVPRYRMRPVPVVFLRFAFSDQLTVWFFSVSEGLFSPPPCFFPGSNLPSLHSSSVSRKSPPASRRKSRNRWPGIGESVHFRVLAAGYPHEAQSLVWLWKERRPHRRQRPWVLLCLILYTVSETSNCAT